MGWAGGWLTPRPDRFTPVRVVQEAGWAARPVWTDAENPDPTGIHVVRAVHKFDFRPVINETPNKWKGHAVIETNVYDTINMFFP